MTKPITQRAKQACNYNSALKANANLIDGARAIGESKGFIDPGESMNIKSTYQQSKPTASTATSTGNQEGEKEKEKEKQTGLELLPLLLKIL